VAAHRPRGGKAGQIVGIDPKAFAASDLPEKWVTDACLVADTYGAVVGIALFEEHADGRGRCVVRGVCEDCTEDDVTDPDPTENNWHCYAYSETPEEPVSPTVFDCFEITGSPALTFPDGSGGSWWLVSGFHATQAACLLACGATEGP
jgi:hypothetical protein